MVIVLSWFGVIAVMSALIPLVAISPILLYIGMLIGAQAFQETPKRHAPGDHPGADPEHRGLGQAFGRQLARRRPAPTPPRSGSTSSARSACSITGLRCWRAAPSSRAWYSAPIGAFVIDKKYAEASAFAAAGAVLTFFGFMHGESVGIAVTPMVALGLCDGRCIPVRFEPCASVGICARTGQGNDSRCRR